MCILFLQPFLNGVSISGVCKGPFANTCKGGLMQQIVSDPPSDLNKFRALFFLALKIMGQPHYNLALQ